MLSDRLLRAGALTAELHGCDLRYVRFGGLETIRRLYVAVRDDAWNTIAGTLDGVEVREERDRFSVTWTQSHRDGEIDFAWTGEIEGRADGTLVYAMRGVARAPFPYNRIGICVLHPSEAAGSPYRARTPDGEITGALPREIGPQRIVDGVIHPLFPSYDELELEQDGVRLRFVFEGDLFEMEDQRNWTDASFKTYSTPLGLGIPHHAGASQVIEQRVAVTAQGEPPPSGDAEEPSIEVGEPLGRGLPQLGLALTSGRERLTTREIDLLERLRLDHLRVDLELGDPRYAEELERADEAAEALGCGLELALFLGSDAAAELDDLAGRIDELRPPVRRALVFREGTAVTPDVDVRLARERLGVPCAGGSNVYFTDVNRNRPDPESLDAVAFSVNPQVHAFDDASLMETVSAQADVVESARALVGGKPVVVSPVTLRPRFNPFVAGEPVPEPDPRQTTRFAAAWTLGSVKYLAQAGADSVTYFEVAGPRGVVDHESDAVYPVYEVLAHLARVKGGELVDARSSAPFVVEVLAVRDAGATSVFVANMTSEPRSCRVSGRRLELAPYAVVLVDQ